MSEHPTISPDGDVTPPSAIPPSIALALLRAQGHIAAVAHDAHNAHAGYSYASAESIMRESREALHREGLVLLIEGVRPHLDRLDVFALVIHPASGESWRPLPRSAAVAQIVSQGGKTSPRDKAESAAETTAIAYMLRGLLLIPRVEYDVDRRHEEAQQQRSRETAPKREPAPESAEQLAEFKAAVEALQRVSSPETLRSIESHIGKRMKGGWLHTSRRGELRKMVDTQNEVLASDAHYEQVPS